MRVYLVLVGLIKLGNRNSVFVKQVKLAEFVRVKPRSVSKMIKELIGIGLVKKIIGGYMINPYAEIKEYRQFHEQVFAKWGKV